VQTEESKPKVLYVDDEENNLLVFKSSFRRFYEVHTASSAAEGLRLLKDNPVDIIISDQRMPDITGVEFFTRLPDEPESIRMLLTGYSDLEPIIEALNLGKIYRYVSKPWKKHELQNILDEAFKALEEKRNQKLWMGKMRQQEASEDMPARVGNDDDTHLTMELIREKEQNRNLKKQVDEAYKNLQLLSEIGQEITSTLNLDEILNTVYENVNQLMDANIFGIGIYNASQNTIDYQLAIENAKRYKPYSRSMDDKNQFPVWCIENKAEVFINDVFEEYKNYITGTDKINADNATLEDGTKIGIPTSLIYMPLMIKEKVIGLITVQSFNKNAYSQYHLNNLRNIGIYVATALENSKAYKMIEQQKTEIQQKNVELEQKVEERTEELRIQRDALEDTYSKLKLLTEIGHEITSTLHLDTILNTVYENVNRLMDASVFGIGMYYADTETIDYRLAIEKGKRYQPYTRTMEDKDQFPVWCIENKKEIFINDVHKEYSRYIKNFLEITSTLEDGTKSEVAMSFIYIPLLFNNEPIGVLSVQSFRKYAYNQYHLDILRSLASYITTAIQNASSYSKMTAAFEQLKAAQSKLIESEKMASLGVLTAGVAHEINNPVNFITGGIESLKDNYADIEQLLRMYLNYDPEKDGNEGWEGIQKLKKQLDPESLLPEVKELLNSIENGAVRTAEIVKGLRNFSRLDESDMKKAGMEEGINNTLVILNNRIKDRIKVIKDYADIPEIICYPGQLNQVFLNILYNAVDAIKGEGTIHIKTWQEGDKINISIRDSGCGMPEHILEHIFEPFFTTKPVGKGTGLGLSISYGIIENHKGKIEVESEVGKGTMFTISLPIYYSR
jgi:signal transduction histidine kinase/YesN/AraC family two-component response regulator